MAENLPAVITSILTNITSKVFDNPEATKPSVQGGAKLRVWSA